MKLIIKLLISFFAVLILFGIGMWMILSNNMKKIQEEELTMINFSTYDDGPYEGLYYYKDQIGAKVEVYIKDGKVEDITLIEHVYGLGGKAESIIDQVILEQSIHVDYISGATTSSKVILLAIENAMESN